MKVKAFFYKFTPYQVIVAYYFIAVIVSTLLLHLPFALQEGVQLSFIDTLFIAVSAISVTGLSVVDITETFSVIGYLILIFILQFGGIGIMTLGTFIWLVLRKRIGLQERRLIMTDQNQISLSGLVVLVKQVLFLILLIEAVGFLILGIYLLKYYPSLPEALLQGLFMSVSATTNAGFDIVGASLVPFANDYFIQFINMMLIILGAIGFPVLIEVKSFLFRKDNHHFFRFSLFTKLTTSTYFALILFGLIMIFLLEYSHFLAGKSWHEKIFYSLFQSVTTRNAGLATMDMADFSVPTLLILSVLMFIGASPSSVGGGIRTTTFAVICLSIYHFARGNRHVRVFKREIHETDIMKAFVVIIVAGILCFTATVLLCVFEPFSLIAIIFEVCSAFGTTGLSLGITADLTFPSKVVMILLMFIGRIGIISFLLIFGREKIKDHYKLLKERVIIG